MEVLVLFLLIQGASFNSIMFFVESNTYTDDEFSLCSFIDPNQEFLCGSLDQFILKKNKYQWQYPNLIIVLFFMPGEHHLA